MTQPNTLASTLRRLSAEVWKKDQPKDTIVLKVAAPNCVLKQDGKSRTVKVRISSDAVDRDNDTVALDGWDTGKYNGVVLFGHRAEDLPVGKSTSIYKQDRFLMSDAKLVTREEYDFGGTVGDMVLGGWLPSASVGFLPKEFERDKEREDSYGWPGINFTKQELLEWSFVSVPSNFEASVMLARSAGIDVTPIRAWAEKGLAAELGEGAWMTKKQLERLFKELGTGKVISLPSEKEPAKAPEKKDLLASDPAHNTDPQAGATPDQPDPNGNKALMAAMGARLDAFHAKMCESLDSHYARTNELHAKIHALSAQMAAYMSVGGTAGDGQGGDADTAGGAAGLRALTHDELVEKMTKKLRRKLARRHARAAAQLAVLDLEAATKKLETKVASHPAHALSKKQLKHVRKAKRHLSRSLALHEAADAQATGTESEPTGDGSPKDTNTAKPGADGKAVKPVKPAPSPAAVSDDLEFEVDEAEVAKLIEEEGKKLGEKVGKDLSDMRLKAGLKAS